MPTYKLRYVVSPPGPFGLPDGKRVVLPAEPGEINSPAIDMTTGKIASYGTLPVYRKDAERLTVYASGGSRSIAFSDNFLAVSIEASDPAEAYFGGTELVGEMLQCVSVQLGIRFWAEFSGAEDHDGKPVRVPQPFDLRLIDLTSYNLKELGQRIETGFYWSLHVDERARKALLYFEHAHLLSEHAQTIAFPSSHGASSRALAFLQLFKAITTLLGDPSSDRDHQRRFRELGLSSDFWTAKVAPLYKVRNDEDVAHYRLTETTATDFMRVFGEAGQVFREAFQAYMTSFLAAMP